MDEITKENSSWIKEGLRFKCTGCGKCCTGSPGYVFLSPQDLSDLSTHLQMKEEEFVAKYTRLVGNRLSLIDRPGTADCIFLKDKKCSAYEARPVQCKTFPWWVDQISSQKAWLEAKEFCEGIEHPEAPLIPRLEIEVQCMSYLDNLLHQNFTLD